MILIYEFIRILRINIGIISIYLYICIITMNVETLLQDYLNYLEIEKNRSPKTRENYERYLKEFLKFAKVKYVEDISDRLVTEFRLFLARRDMKKITQSYYVIAIRNFLKYLKLRGILLLSQG